VSALERDRDEEIRRLVRDLLDAQREQLAESRHVSERSLELQERAILQQEELRRLYRRLVLVGGSLVVVLLAVFVYLVLIYYLLAGWSRYLFGV
jgi:cytochrome c-type biogenesis protein CcmH/NrfG